MLPKAPSLTTRLPTLLPTFLRPTPSPPCTLQTTQTRTYRAHTWFKDPIAGMGVQNRGRSVVVGGGRSAIIAYTRLKDILEESNVRATVRRQERFERNHDKKRRKRGEKEFRMYLDHVRDEVKKAWDLRQREEADRNHLEDEAPSSKGSASRRNDYDDDDDDDDDAIFAELEKDDDDLLSDLRERRIEEIRTQIQKAKEEATLFHGTYDTLRNEKDVLQVTTTTKLCIVHFAHRDFRRCQIMDRHLSQLAQTHRKTRFCKIYVEDCPFLVERLKVQILPCVISFVDGVTADRLIGFEELGNNDSFPTSSLEKRLAKGSKVISLESDEAHSRQRKTIYGFADKDDSSDDDD
ncbi:hypothetical protein HDV00_009238 [Rhizophlyctis rosea]|nr:hypothetical protein HDV00_009238 [Rhizophlyctis rosea]